MLEGGFGGAEGDGVGHSAVNLGGDVAGADLVGDKINRVPTRGGVKTDDLGDVDRDGGSSGVRGVR